MARKKKIEDVAEDKPAKAAKKKPTPPKLEKPDYGVDFVAEALGIAAFTVRVKLRQAGIKKDGRTYDFGTKKAAEAIVKQLKAKAKTEAAEADEADDDKPATKKKKKRTKKTDD